MVNNMESRLRSEMVKTIKEQQPITDAEKADKEAIVANKDTLQQASNAFAELEEEEATLEQKAKDADAKIEKLDATSKAAAKQNDNNIVTTQNKIKEENVILRKRDEQFDQLSKENAEKLELKK